MNNSSVMQMTIWTREQLSDRQIAERFFEAMARTFPKLFPTRWGECEPLSVTATIDNYTEVVNFWAELSHSRSRLIGKRGSIDLSVNYMLGPTKQANQIWLSFPIKTICSSKKLQSSIDLFKEWIEILRADFALYVDESEWISKNVYRNYVEKDGTENAWKLFGNDITKGIPGIYWCTYFGPAFANWLGEMKLVLSPWPFVEKVCDGYFLQRSGSPLNWTQEKDFDIRLLAHLGKNRFFDINFPKRSIEKIKLEIPK